MGLFEKLKKKPEPAKIAHNENANTAKAVTPPAPKLKPKIINAKIVGVTFENRQELLSECFEGQELIIKKTPVKNYPWAMGVYTVGEDNPEKAENLLGFVEDELAKDLFVIQSERAINDDPRKYFEGLIDSLSGGTEDKQTIGCNILIYAE